MQKYLLLFLVLLALPCRFLYAHVGSPGVVLQGVAGPYHLLVQIKPPDVIPGTAEVTIFLQDPGNPAISVRPVYFYSGAEGAPSADRLLPVTGKPGQYYGKVWMMSSGSSSVEISVEGSRSKGQLIVPVMAVSTAEKKLPAATGIGLVALGFLLFILLITIGGASVGEALTKRGEDLPARRKRNKRIAMGIAALLSVLIVYGGNAWWKSLESKYRRFLFKPLDISCRLEKDAGGSLLSLAIDTLQKRQEGLSYIIPDHGKLMHLFLVRIPAMDAFAHLHPVRLDSAHFITRLPPLPAGKYLVYADVVYRSGFLETMKDTLELTNGTPDSFSPADPDDAYALTVPFDSLARGIGPGAKQERPAEDKTTAAVAGGVPALNTIVCGKPGTGVRLKDGSEMVMESSLNEDLVAGELCLLRFSLYDAGKKPLKPEPYLGMMGHAAIIRSDGKVYIHIHPVGTYSVAAQASLFNRMALPVNEYALPPQASFRDSIDQAIKHLRELPEKDRNEMLLKEMDPGGESPGKDGRGTMPGMTSGNMISFPYTFPGPGSYRIWVQVKSKGQVLTAAFDRNVR